MSGLASGGGVKGPARIVTRTLYAVPANNNTGSAPMIFELSTHGDIAVALAP